MGQVLIKPISFICMILLGYLMKRAGLFGPTDYKILSKIVLNVTIPCAAIVSFAAYQPDLSVFLVALLGFGMNGLMLVIAYFTSTKQSRQSRAVWLNCIPGYNIGSFAMPFVQSFLSPASLVGTCLFNAGNALMCNGTTFAISKNILDGTKGLNLKYIGKTLLRSVPFLVQFFLLIISLFRVPIPDVVVSFVKPAANANAFVAMMMVGMMFNPKIEKSCMREIGGILAIRYIVAAIAAAVFYFLLPLPLEIRQALAVTVFAPVGTVATALSPTIGGDPAVAAGANSLSIPISICCMIGLLAAFGIL